MLRRVRKLEEQVSATIDIIYSIDLVGGKCLKIKNHKETFLSDEEYITDLYQEESNGNRVVDLYSLWYNSHYM